MPNVNPTLIGDLISNIVVLGSLYALVGVGFVILFRSTGVVNFAQGSFMVLGAYIFYALFVQLGLPLGIAIVGGVLGVAALGALVYFAMFYRMVGAELFTVVVATMGLALLLQTITLIIWGPNTRVVPDVLPREPIISIGPVEFNRLDVGTILASGLLILVLELGLQRTLLGVRMRAVADSALLAALQRIDVPRFSGLAWAIAALCSAGGGIAVALRTAVDPVNIGQLGLLIFPVVIIGGVDSIKGALVGGILVAIIQVVTELVLGGTWVDPVAYIVLLVMLLVRPRGLFGTREIVRI